MDANTATPTHRLLRNCLADLNGMESVKGNPFVVSCFYCDMTMWSFSDTAHVELETDRIVCNSRDCRGKDAIVKEEPEYVF